MFRNRPQTANIRNDRNKLNLQAKQADTNSKDSDAYNIMQPHEPRVVFQKVLDNRP